tara:strand:- start:60 stop:803 length:744 start_codon:yes stop_codon:yes gene_type:complete
MTLVNNYHFPNQIVDNFFEDPKKIVEFAETLKYDPCSEGKWPGVRSIGLHKINYPFFNSVLNKIFSMFYDYNIHKVNWKDTQMYFQKTHPYDLENKNNIVNHGLVHCDGEQPIVGLVYLTEGADIESGTSIMSQGEGYSDEQIEKIGRKHENKKKHIYKQSPENLTKKDLEEYAELIKDCNSGYVENIKINNIFNRAIFYSGSDYHKANSFYTGEKERLTLVFFIKAIETTGYSPLQRLRLCKTVYE